MHADELRQAVNGIVALFKAADIRTALDQYRASRGDDRTVATARLTHAGATIADGVEKLTPAARRVLRLLHLDEMGTADFWQNMTDESRDAKTRQGEIVRVASRLMFASGQLPLLVGMLDAESDAVPVDAVPLADGEGRLSIRLVDAGEKAADPDRIARSIDGVDMLYSACASIARRPAVDLRMDRIDGSGYRDLSFSGERESLSAVIAVIESMPAALADINPASDIDLQAVVSSLPIFADLEKLAALGSFSSRDLKDISETMHQGALLVLESGVALVDSSSSAAGGTPATGAAVVVGGAVQGNGVNPVDGADEHYERYLRERDAMQRPASNGVIEAPGEDRQDAVAELLKSLEQSRNS